MMLMLCKLQMVNCFHKPYVSLLSSFFSIFLSIDVLFPSVIALINIFLFVGGCWIENEDL